MGCDIHIVCEVKQVGAGWVSVKDAIFDNHYADIIGQPAKTCSPFDFRDYDMFACLAGVRNDYHAAMPISEPKSLPNDASAYTMELYNDWIGDAHGASYLTLRELVEFDYSQQFGTSGKTYREIIGGKFFADIEKMKELGGLDDVRVVFFFDN